MNHLTIKTYELKGIRVTVKVDYDNQQISLVQQNPNGTTNTNYIDKHWVFSHRGLDYMQGWQDILQAMQFAISEAKKELKTHVDKEEKRKANLMVKIMSDEVRFHKGKTTEK